MAFFYTGAEGLVLACGLGLVAALTETPKARQARFGEPRRRATGTSFTTAPLQVLPFTTQG